MDVIQILQHLRAGASNSQLKRDLKISRKTARNYRKWAQKHELLSGPLPPIEELEGLRAETFGKALPPQNVSSVEPYRDTVMKLLDQGVEIAAIYNRLEERGFDGSYWSVYRFVKSERPDQPDVTVRVECQPGEEAQVDFGYAGLMLDAESKRRRTWAFVMTLSWSRHQYVEFVFDQKAGTWLRCHRNAFTFLNGVPQRVVVDNLKAAIIRACWEDPQVQLAYGECAEHYGFVIAPCRVRTPQHKGKVEQGGVHYVKRNFLGGREATTLIQANQHVRHWCLERAGKRIHGTTKERPLLRFEQVEQAQLKPLPAAPYDLAVWKEVKLHRDCHVVFDNAYYSAPFQLVNQQLCVRGGSHQVRLYNSDYQLVATHDRAQKPGERMTHPGHLPPEKIAGLYMTREVCLETAGEIGVATAEVVQRLLNDKRVERLPTVRRLLKLRQAYGDPRLEAACARALRFDDPSYQTVKRILQQGLEFAITPAPPASAAPAGRFARSVSDILGNWLGGLTWS
jgi:transposase